MILIYKKALRNKLAKIKFLHKLITEKMIDIENYCNAGVLLINVEKIKKTQLFCKCRKYIYTHKMIMP